MPDRQNDPIVPFGPHHRNGANGVRPDGLPTHPMRARLFAMSVPDDTVDMVAVQADDELINALAAGMTVSASGMYGRDTDDQVATILAAWKAEVDAEPIPEIIDVDTAIATIQAASAAAPSRRVRHLAPVAAAAAFAVFVIGGVSAGSAAAEPDSIFWPVSRVLFSERAASIEAADRAEDHITRAKAALSEGKPDVAAQELQQAQSDLGQVRPQEGQAQLADVQSFLVAKAVETPPGVKVDPETPLRRDPQRPVPAALTQVPGPSGTLPAPPAPTSAPVVTVDPVTSYPPVAGSVAGSATTSPQSTITPTPDGTKDPLPPPPVTETGGTPSGPPGSTTSTGMGATTTPVPELAEAPGPTRTGAFCYEKTYESDSTASA